MMPTSEASITDALLILYAAMSEEEKESAFQQLRERRSAEQGYAENEMAKYVHSLSRVASVVGHPPTVTEYKETSQALREAGEDVETFTQLYKFFDRSWPRTREAVELSGEVSPRSIEARFQRRSLGMPARYTEDVLRETVARAAEHFGYPPNTEEFTWWREREIECAKARGEQNPQIPALGPYYSRWKTWEAALLHFGYTPEQIAVRLQQRAKSFINQADPDLPGDLPVATLATPTSEEAGDLPLSGEEAAQVRAAYEALPKRTRHVLTARFGLGGTPKQPFREIADALALHRSRVQQLQLSGLDTLVQAVDSRKTTRPGLRAAVVEALGVLAKCEW